MCFPGSQLQSSVLCCLGILNFHQYNFLTVAVDTVSLRRAQVCDWLGYSCYECPNGPVQTQTQPALGQQKLEGLKPPTSTFNQDLQI